MPISLINPGGLPEVEVYKQVSIATGTRLVHVAGQVAVDSDGSTVGAGDLAAQVEQAYVNVGTALAAAGGSFDDLAKLNVHVVGWTPDQMPLLLDGIARAARRMGTTPMPPATLLGVAALASPDYLVEVEATAVLD
ncbi:RidA family protein [Streptomyces sp. NPDC048057]|uniref:RidA family protein n=1 Tax=Streptomyces sp. NPDC048057 TaxID=3155628 RepID=UPI0033E1A5E3